MFDPALAGYWGADSFEQALETALAVINVNVAKVAGIKISLLDKDKEIQMRRRLPSGVRRQASGCLPATTSTIAN